MNLKATARVGDAERWKMAEFLGEMYAQGVLTKSEYEARLGQALHMATAAGLKALACDMTEQWFSWNAAASSKEAEQAKLTDPIPVVRGRGSILMFTFAVVLAMFGAAGLDVAHSGRVSIMEGIGIVIAALVIGIREIATS